MNDGWRPGGEKRWLETTGVDWMRVEEQSSWQTSRSLVKRPWNDRRNAPCHFGSCPRPSTERHGACPSTRAVKTCERRMDVLKQSLCVSWKAAVSDVDLKMNYEMVVDEW